MIVRLLACLLLVPSALAAQTGTLVVVNQKQHAVDLVDPTTRKVLAAVSVGVNGHEVALGKGGRMAYVPIYSNTGVGKPGTDGQMIDVIDLATAKVWSAEGVRAIASTAQHLHGGIGADLDYSLHRYHAWAKYLELFLGPAPAFEEELGALLAEHPLQASDS